MEGWDEKPEKITKCKGSFPVTLDPLKEWFDSYSICESSESDRWAGFSYVKKKKPGLSEDPPTFTFLAITEIRYSPANVPGKTNDIYYELNDEFECNDKEYPAEIIRPGIAIGYGNIDEDSLCVSGKRYDFAFHDQNGEYEVTSLSL